MIAVKIGIRVDWEILWNSAVVLRKLVLDKTW
jgi:hypothetical protein